MSKPPSKPYFQLRRAHEIEKKPVQWLWKSYIPRGMLTLVTGDPQAGKSTLMCEIVAAISTGRPLPGETENREPENCWIMSSEDDAETTIVWRLENQGANLDRIWITDRRNKLEGKGLREMMRIIAENQIGLCIIDTLTTWMGGDLDMNRGNEVMAWLNALHEIALETGCTFLLVRHRRKGPPNDAKLQAGMGSMGFTASVRSELMAYVRKDKKAKCDRRIFERTKGNIGKPPPKLEYDIHDGPDPDANPHGIFQWLDAFEEIDFGEDEPIKVSRTPRKLGEARQFLREFLKDGAKPALDVMRAGADLGITERTLKRAKDGMVESRQVAKGEWVWLLIPPDNLKTPGVQTCH